MTDNVGPTAESDAGRWQVRHLASGVTLTCRDQDEANAHVRESASGPWVAERVLHTRTQTDHGDCDAGREALRTRLFVALTEQRVIDSRKYGEAPYAPITWDDVDKALASAPAYNHDSECPCPWCYSERLTYSLLTKPPYVTNPEAIGDPDQTPIVQHSVSGCPAHSEDWLYRAVRNNRRLEELPPQDCTCPTCPSECGRNEPCSDPWHDRQTSDTPPANGA